MIEDIRRAVHVERRWLHSLLHNPHRVDGPMAVPLRLRPAEVNAMLRVEVNDEAFMDSIRPRDFGFDPELARKAWQDGRCEIDGVTYYLLRGDAVPAPGWRVINPMRVK